MPIKIECDIDSQDKKVEVKVIKNPMFKDIELRKSILERSRAVNLNNIEL